MRDRRPSRIAYALPVSSDLRDRLQSSLGNAYTLEHELTGGAMARVFVAEERALGRHVAVKVLQPELSADLDVERFRREMRIAGTLQHPHIVPVLSAGESDGIVFYTMPFVEGLTLRARLERDSQLPINEAVRIAHDIAEALTYAHARGIVHRDIKPENVLLSGGHALLTDFGIAKAVLASHDERLTATGLSLGTPAYIAPEQAAAEAQVDERADVYALGCVLYEMLTGQAPYLGPTAQSIIAQHLAGPVPSSRLLRATVPPDLDAVVCRAMAKSKVDRFATAEQFDRAATSALSSNASAALPTAKMATPARIISNYSTLAALVVVAAIAIWFLAVHPVRGSDERTMIAVLPFRNLGPSSDGYFADGITEEITNRLASLQGVGVISRTSADAYKGTNKSIGEIGRELGVVYVLEGTVQTNRSSGGSQHVRVSSQLVRTSNDSSLWSDQYNASLGDLFRLQGNVAERVASILSLRLGARERQALTTKTTENLDAYDAYLRGNELRGTGPFEVARNRAAISMYERAIALDSTFALAYSQLAQALIAVYRFGGADAATLARAKSAAERAVRIAPASADSHDALGRYYQRGIEQLDLALAEFNRALELRPSDALAINGIALIRSLTGDYAGSITQYRHSLKLNPLSSDAAEGIVRQEMWLHRYDDAQRYLGRSLVTYAYDPGMYLLQGALIMLRAGDSTTARRALAVGVMKVGAEKLFMAYVSRRDMKLLPASLLPEVTSITIEPQRRDGAYFLTKALAAYENADSSSAQVFADSARHFLTTVIREHGGGIGTALIESELAVGNAVLGRGEEAFTLANHALSIATNPQDSLMIRTSLARVAAMTGHENEATDLLRQMLTAPSEVSVQGLRADPTWNRLRTAPRFQALLAGCSSNSNCR